MSEIASCPICGKEPGWHDFDIETRIFDGDQYATLEARHAALVEAVAWERECE